jgi:hypothetical protein
MSMQSIVRHARRLACATAVAAFAGGVVPALASACTVPQGGTTVFQTLGDLADYVPVPQGTFETGTSGWSLSRAWVVSGNETSYVHSSTDSHSLLISPGGSAVSSAICVGSTTPTFRFFARSARSGLSMLSVNLLWTDAFGFSHTTPVGGLLGFGQGWQASPSLALSIALPLWMPGSTLSVRLQFVPQWGSAWAIDDVYQDPYRPA